MTTQNNQTTPVQNTAKRALKNFSREFTLQMPAGIAHSKYTKHLSMDAHEVQGKLFQLQVCEGSKGGTHTLIENIKLKESDVDFVDDYVARLIQRGYSEVQHQTDLETQAPDKTSVVAAQEVARIDRPRG